MWRACALARISRIFTRGTVILRPARRRCDGSTECSSLKRPFSGNVAVQFFLIITGIRRQSIQMNPPRIVIPTHRWLTATVLFSVLLALSAGCVYRPNIQQGNLLKLDDVNQVTVGMTRSQVRYLLGTPMVADPFQPDRWD